MSTYQSPGKSVLAIAIACALLAACSAAPTKPDGAANLRSRLTQLQGNPDLASRAPLAIKEADVAVTAAERPQTDAALSAHLVFMADRKISIAEATAQNHLAVDQRKTLSEQREAMRLQARTNEADSANRRATVAIADASAQKLAADSANLRAATATADANDQRRDADAERNANAAAQSNALELQRQLDAMQAKVTDRGLVLTLGDVLFATGTANLNMVGDSHLGKLAAFLNKYPDRTTLIEGHTDSIGSDDYNQALSQRRADAVKLYLVAQGIDSSRLNEKGRPEGRPSRQVLRVNQFAAA